ncbi:helix-turn-helix transcriptional regulator [Fibrella forsythiae]|uniref:WYL domain-containing protein n=1 Tax=Fibrella forsythiae TaxID=2817061 RepID=A0ABS3JNY4_9BACT|nr:WYL domain-containing protein [Fibrella forsythiae]MBO0951693.1 WYL domain-containing protein [Fibrella forsythiae]
MPANRNALIRYRAIDTCLTNRFRQWTLDLLIEKVGEALYEYEGIAQISRRTIQADLQMMRSDKLGYNAPIVVIDRKYYTYEDPTYSITNGPLSGHDLEQISEAVDVLKQFKGFSHFRNLSGVVQKLEAHVFAATANQQAVIDFETNDNLRGLTYLDSLYRSIIEGNAVWITYQSFRAKDRQVIPFHVWWLKEFRNRWFAVGVKGNRAEIMHLALDRMLSLDPAPDLAYRPNPGNVPADYYRQAIGVTVSATLPPLTVLVRVDRQQAPYIETKPLHASQRLEERRDDGDIVISLQIQHNYELERDILAFGEGLELLAPIELRNRLAERLRRAYKQYEATT